MMLAVKRLKIVGIGSDHERWGSRWQVCRIIAGREDISPREIKFSYLVQCALSVDSIECGRCIADER
jgi:hypothetical protein